MLDDTDARVVALVDGEMRTVRPDRVPEDEARQSVRPEGVIEGDDFGLRCAVRHTSLLLA